MDYGTDDITFRASASSRTRNGRGGVARSASPRPWHRVALLSVAAAAMLLATAAGADALASNGRVHPGVSVGGVDIGGQTPQAALATLKASLPAKLTTVTVVRGGRTWHVSARQVGATFDYAKLIADAEAVGRSGGPLVAVGQRAHSWTGGTELAAPAIADQRKLDAAVARIGSAIDTAPRDAALKISASGVAVRPSVDSVRVDRKVLAGRLIAAFGPGAAHTVSVPAAVAKPRVQDAAATRAAAVAKRMIGEPATVSYGSKSWTLSRAELARMISVRTAGPSAQTSSAVLVPFVDPKLAEKIVVAKVGAALGSQPVDARFVAQGASVRVIPSKDGVGPDVEDFSANLTSVLQQGEGERSVQLRTKVTSPSLTTQRALAMGVREQISTFTTTYSTGLASRVNNIQVLGAALDGKLVAPGDTFSLNEAVGERTASKGYQQANAIVQGKLVSQMGGGICQVATTMFNAVFMSGLPITERVPHSFYIAHYPMGRDCTVSWGGPDLRWKNTTSNWVLVSVARGAGSITVSLYGTSPGYDVAYTTSAFTNDVPFKTSKVSDPTLPAGKQRITAPGANGGKAVVVRKVTKNGALVRTDTFTSHYVPVVQVLAVGTMKPTAPVSVASLAPKKR